MNIDLHVHSNHSDGSNSVKELAEECKRNGLSGFALTDHNTVDGFKHVRKEKEVIIIPGIEISSLKGHVVALGVNELVPEHLSVEETLDLIRGQGAISVAAHPFDFLGKGVRNFRKCGFDGVEVLNAQNLDEYSNMIADKHSTGLVRTAGSDAHHKKFIGTCYTIFKDVSDADDALKQLRKKRTEVGGRVFTPEEYIEMVKLTENAEKCTDRPFLYVVASKTIETIPTRVANQIAKGVILFIKGVNVTNAKIRRL